MLFEGGRVVSEGWTILVSSELFQRGELFHKGGPGSKIL